MPTYEYECKECGHTFDAFQSMSDAPLKDCPQCGGVVRRLINGGSGIIFKGSGFYVTDKKNSAAAKTSAVKSSDTAKTGDSAKPSAQPTAQPASGSAEAAKTPAAVSKPAETGAKAGAEKRAG
jgi:putative FmdB family regulatory protein